MPTSFKTFLGIKKAAMTAPCPRCATLLDECAEAARLVAKRDRQIAELTREFDRLNNECSHDLDLICTRNKQIAGLLAALQTILDPDTVQAVKDYPKNPIDWHEKLTKHFSIASNAIETFKATF